MVADVAALDPEAVAICLLFSYVEPAHEERLAAALREADPELHVSASSEVLPQFREYERCATTVLDAYLVAAARPLPGPAARALPRARHPGAAGDAVLRRRGRCRGGRARRRLERAQRPGGGSRRSRACSRRPRGTATRSAWTWAGRRATSAWSRTGGCAAPTRGSFAGRPIQLPMVDVHTVGAGGGSIGWRDSGGALRVGPDSAGAEPGPACYGRGGTEPTVTDANLLLGYLGTEAGLAGGIELDREAAAARRRRARRRARAERGRDGGGDRRGRQRRDDPRPARRLGRARDRSQAVRAARLRRRRPPPRRRDRRRARDPAHPLSPLRRSPVGARPGRFRSAA